MSFRAHLHNQLYLTIISLKLFIVIVSHKEIQQFKSNLMVNYTFWKDYFNLGILLKEDDFLWKATKVIEIAYMVLRIS